MSFPGGLDFPTYVRVIARIRPSSEQKKANSNKQDVLRTSSQVQMNALLDLESSSRVGPAMRLDENGCELFDGVKVRDLNGSWTVYKLDGCYGQFASQSTLFEQEVGSLILSDYLVGPVTVFAFGASGTGKTYTMSGTSNAPGLVKLSVDCIFKQILNHPRWSEHNLVASFVEVCEDRLVDLSTDVKAGTRRKLTLREDTAGVVHVSGLSEVVILSADHFHIYYQSALSRRRVGRTSLNETSSRGHAFLTLYLRDKVGKYTTRLNLIDLAGSEDNRKTENRGTRITESSKINASLFTLGKVLGSLADGNTKRIPYRDSKLTRLLQDSLGGTSKTLMICTLCSDVDRLQEMKNVLAYACKARNVQSKPQIILPPKKEMAILSDGMLRKEVPLVSCEAPTGVGSIENGNANPKASQPEAMKRKFMELIKEAKTASECSGQEDTATEVGLEDVYTLDWEPVISFLNEAAPPKLQTLHLIGRKRAASLSLLKRRKGNIEAKDLLEIGLSRKQVQDFFRLNALAFSRIANCSK